MQTIRSRRIRLKSLRSSASRDAYGRVDPALAGTPENPRKPASRMDQGKGPPECSSEEWHLRFLLARQECSKCVRNPIVAIRLSRYDPDSRPALAHAAGHRPTTASPRCSKHDGPLSSRTCAGRVIVRWPLATRKSFLPRLGGAVA